MIATVTVTRYQDYGALLMRWERDVHEADVRIAFEAIMAHLEASVTPLCVIVDLRENPKFPLATTIRSAIMGPYQHPMLDEWLVIGSNAVAHQIERTLSAVTRRRNVRWFADEAEVMTYLDSLVEKQ